MKNISNKNKRYPVFERKVKFAPALHKRETQSTLPFATAI